MESIKEIEKKKGSRQISMRTDLELAEQLEAAAQEKGLTLAEHTKAVLKASVQGETKPKPVKSLNEISEADGDFVVLLKESNGKQDQVIDLLEKLVETAKPAEPETNLVYSEEDFNSALGNALLEQELELNKEHLLIRLTESQKSVISKLLAYRKEKGKIFSGSIEELFFYIMKEAINDSWNAKHPEFESEFKEAFADYFQQIKSL